MQPAQRLFSKFKDMSWGQHTVHALAGLGATDLASTVYSNVAEPLMNSNNHTLQLAGIYVLGACIAPHYLGAAYSAGNVVAGAVKMATGHKSNFRKAAPGRLQPR